MPDRQGAASHPERPSGNGAASSPEMGRFASRSRSERRAGSDADRAPRTGGGVRASERGKATRNRFGQNAEAGTPERRTGAEAGITKRRAGSATRSSRTGSERAPGPWQQRGGNRADGGGTRGGRASATDGRGFDRSAGGTVRPERTRSDRPVGPRRDQPDGSRRDQPDGKHRDQPRGSRRDQGGGAGPGNFRAGRASGAATDRPWAGARENRTGERVDRPMRSEHRRPSDASRPARPERVGGDDRSRGIREPRADRDRPLQGRFDGRRGRDDRGDSGRGSQPGRSSFAADLSGAFSVPDRNVRDQPARRPRWGQDAHTSRRDGPGGRPPRRQHFADQGPARSNPSSRDDRPRPAPRAERDRPDQRGERGIPDRFPGDRRDSFRSGPDRGSRVREAEIGEQWPDLEEWARSEQSGYGGAP